MNVASNRGFSRSSNLPVPLEFTPDRPLFLWYPSGCFWTENSL